MGSEPTIKENAEVNPFDTVSTPPLIFQGKLTLTSRSSHLEGNEFTRKNIEDVVITPADAVALGIFVDDSLRTVGIMDLHKI